MVVGIDGVETCFILKAEDKDHGIDPSGKLQKQKNIIVVKLTC